MGMTISDKAEFKERVRHWAKKLDARVTSISVRPMTTKWASYSTTGRLTFDACLPVLREELQDYVIVHEMLHFHTPNHGKLWKSLMRAYLGDYKGLETELNEQVAKQRAESPLASSRRWRRFTSGGGTKGASLCSRVRQQEKRLS